ncbi:hypothetical protein RhiirA5_502184 [Rhizophagus irregularis]|uniref:Uncharacterized protein n=1 Tax=Rhizophagus irregularis TaxID=588596 RepID=A0A2N0PEU8_9GLOM|nr:hypothetical protein RhiirA5_502184 [Rhizophagus irregularis]GBC26649.1 hypothetical protein RIR_jg17748.t1 [Rhizophagus irregularis DAOM 181602=DAOM 197198]UZO02307.1 hypothetical protein OCT59_020791 [Rhizophagus irregularis]CAB4470490.1 unnamed protein product [Rhizophagus irregularis]CAB5216625.1 unnamed protein product [Rhizophagus irregularis]
MRFNIDSIFCLILINISIVLASNLKDESELNIRISPQHYKSLNILISHVKRETSPYPLNFVPSRTNPFRKRSQNEHEKNSKNSRRKRIISKRNPS